LKELRTLGHNLDQMIVQAIVPGTYMFLNLYNVYTSNECAIEDKINNFMIILSVTLHAFGLSLLAVAWRISLQTMHFKGIDSRLNVYVYFLSIAVYSYICKFMIIDCFDVFTALVFNTMCIQLITLAIVGATCNILLFIFCKYLGTAEIILKENRYRCVRWMNLGIELIFALFIWDQTSRPIHACNFSSNLDDVIYAVGIINLFNTIYYSGYYIFICEWTQWNYVKRVMATTIPPTLNELAETQTCAMCDDDFGDDPVSKTECEHIFHSFCLREWLDINPICPVCEVPFEPDETIEYNDLKYKDFVYVTEGDFWNPQTVEVILTKMEHFETNCSVFSDFESLYLKNQDILELYYADIIAASPARLLLL